MPEKRIKDFSRDVILRKAEAAIEKHDGPEKAKVFFKFYCEACGERCTFKEPNELFETGVCFKCGHETVIEKAGFMVIVDRDERLILPEGKA